MRPVSVFERKRYIGHCTEAILTTQTCSYYLHCRLDKSMSGMWARQSVNRDSESSAEDHFSIELLMYFTCVNKYFGISRSL
jgi:hypothetical protein